MVQRIKDKIFYGWVVVVTTLIIACALFGVRYSFGVFFKSLQGEFDLTRAVTAGVFSAYLLFNAVFGFVSGWALDRYGPRLVVALMGLFTGLSLIMTSQTNSLWQIFLSYSLLLSIGTAGGMPMIVSAVSRWFDKKRGIAMGITTSATGLGTLVVAPLAAYLISNLGWRMSYMVMALVAWLVVISLAMLLRRDPSEIGALPDGVKSSSVVRELKGKEEGSQSRSLSVPQALRTKSFWLMFTNLSLVGFSFSLVITHVVPYATDAGISTLEAATVLSIMSAIQIPSRLIVGRIIDSAGRIIPGVICALLGTVALMLLIGSRSLGMFYLFAIVFGFFWGGIGVVNLTLVGDIFGGHSLGAIMGVQEVGFSIWSAVGATLGGFIFDVTDSYVMAFALGAAATSIMALNFVAISRQVKRRVG